MTPETRIKELERLVRCSLRVFKRYLNTPETQILKRAAKRYGLDER